LDVRKIEPVSQQSDPEI